MEYWLLEFTGKTFLFITKALFAFHGHVVRPLAIMASVKVLNTARIVFISAVWEIIFVEWVFNTAILAYTEFIHFDIPF
jgi:hypothetical protein